MSDDDEIEIASKITEIDFGYHHVNETNAIYPGRCQMLCRKMSVVNEVLIQLGKFIWFEGFC